MGETTKFEEHKISILSQLKKMKLSIINHIHNMLPTKNLHLTKQINDDHYDNGEKSDDTDNEVLFCLVAEIGNL